MARDEAILRIVLDSAGGNASQQSHAPGSTTGQTGPAAPSKSTPVPVEVVRNTAPTPPPSQPNAAPDWLKSLINPDWSKNPHVLLEGQSGSGKSVAARHIAFERMRLGHDVHVVDPHNPEKWGGAKQVFQGDTAGPEAAKFMMDLLKGRIKEQQDAGDVPVDFKPVTVVLSDFANMMKNTPSLQTEFAHILTEARKFKIAIVADTTMLNQAESGLKGIDNVRRNLGQKAQFLAGTDADPQRRVRIAAAGAVRANKDDPLYDTPQLPMYEDRIDYGLKKSSAETTSTTLVGAAAAAKRKFEAEKYKKEVEEEYQKLVPPEIKPVKTAFDAMLDFAQDLRGTIGGTFGRVVGAMLDVTAQVRKMRAAAIPKAVLPGAVPQALPEDKVPEAVLPGKEDDLYQWDIKTAEKVPKAALAAPPPTAEMAPDQGKKGLAGMLEGAAPMIAIATVIGSAVVAGFKMVSGEANKMANTYGEYDPAIAQAQAQAEMRKVLGDMRRAEEASGELAAFVEAQSQMQDRWEDLKVKIMTKIVPVVTGILEVLGALFGLASKRDADEELKDPTTILLGNQVEVPG